MIAGSRFVIDSSVWVEYLENFADGKKAAEILEGEGNIIITPRIVLAEVYSKALRKGGDAEKARQIMEAFSAPWNEDNETYFLAGKIHAELRKKFRDASLADAVVMSVARMSNATLVTKDLHQNGKGAIFIK